LARTVGSLLASLGSIGLADLDRLAAALVEELDWQPLVSLVDERSATVPVGRISIIEFPENFVFVAVDFRARPVARGAHLWPQTGDTDAGTSPPAV
jgi:hypothetical protein